MNDEIKINFNVIIEKEEELKKLQNFVENKTANVSFTASKGETVDALIELSKKLEETKKMLAQLYGNTVKALEATRTTFNETDNTLANYFESFREITQE